MAAASASDAVPVTSTGGGGARCRRAGRRTAPGPGTAATAATAPGGRRRVGGRSPWPCRYARGRGSWPFVDPTPAATGIVSLVRPTPDGVELRIHAGGLRAGDRLFVAAAEGTVRWVCDTGDVVRGPDGSLPVRNRSVRPSRSVFSAARIVGDGLVIGEYDNTSVAPAVRHVAHDGGAVDVHDAGVQRAQGAVRRRGPLVRHGPHGFRSPGRRSGARPDRPPCTSTAGRRRWAARTRRTTLTATCLDGHRAPAPPLAGRDEAPHLPEQGGPGTKRRATRRWRLYRGVPDRMLPRVTAVRTIPAQRQTGTARTASVCPDLVVRSPRGLRAAPRRRGAPGVAFRPPPRLHPVRYATGSLLADPLGLPEGRGKGLPQRPPGTLSWPSVAAVIGNRKFQLPLLFSRWLRMIFATTLHRPPWHRGALESALT